MTDNSHFKLLGEWQQKKQAANKPKVATKRVQIDEPNDPPQKYATKPTTAVKRKNKKQKAQAAAKQQFPNTAPSVDNSINGIKKQKKPLKFGIADAKPDNQLDNSMAVFARNRARTEWPVG